MWDNPLHDKNQACHYVEQLGNGSESKFKSRFWNWMVPLCLLCLEKYLCRSDRQRGRSHQWPVSGPQVNAQVLHPRRQAWEVRQEQTTQTTPLGTRQSKTWKWSEVSQLRLSFCVSCRFTELVDRRGKITAKFTHLPQKTLRHRTSKSKAHLKVCLAYFSGTRAGLWGGRQRHIHHHPFRTLWERTKVK